MIVRIVRMSFIPDKVNDFILKFNKTKDKIRAFDGCEYLALHRDLNNANIYFTVSHWESPQHLEAYRKSELFKITWGEVKLLFNDQPLAYSLREIED